MIRCIGYELYKFMVQKKGILIFVVYFIFKIISVVTSPGVQHNKENIRQKMYMDIYYRRWGGELDIQKINLSVLKHRNKRPIGTSKMNLRSTQGLLKCSIKFI